MDLQEAAIETATDDVIAELEVQDIACPSWTTFEVTNNRLKLVAGGDLTDEDGFFFHNVRFEVYSVLRFEFHAHFFGDMPADDEVSACSFSYCCISKRLPDWQQRSTSSVYFPLMQKKVGQTC